MESKMSDKTTMRPWGTYTELLNETFCKVKSILVNPGQRISLQMHKHRIEHWTIVSGEGELELGWAPSSLKKRRVKAGSTCKIAKKQIHRITNTSSTEPLVFIEVQRGESFEEEDIVRYEDDYGRAE
jgi:mannose-6-phosphate isomerase-like protein (cupin superfamily)